MDNDDGWDGDEPSPQEMSRVDEGLINNVDVVQKPSTKRPVVKRKAAVKQSEEDAVLDEVMTTLQDVKKRNLDEDRVYGQTIAFSMRNIKDP